MIFMINISPIGNEKLYDVFIAVTNVCNSNRSIKKINKKRISFIKINFGWKFCIFSREINKYHCELSYEGLLHDFDSLNSHLRPVQRVS